LKAVDEQIRKRHGEFDTKIQQQQKEFNLKLQKQVKEFENNIQKQRGEYETQTKRQYGDKQILASERKGGMGVGLLIGILASLFLYSWVSWLEWNEPTQKVSKNPSKQKSYYRLTINPKPINSQVKIMNIEPRYRPGIILRRGQYVIKVEHPNHSDKYECVTIKDHNVSIDVRLKKGKTK
jgi:hypothetical protein